VITQGFNDRAAVDQYARFVDDVVELVVNRYDGALKAEHGTGRNMAPFVETEWGSAGYEIMRRLKELADPHNLLNPGVIINPDRRAHLEDLKRIPTIEAEVDKCIECGYGESKCPSRELTLTPRQRIVVRREMARLQNGDNSKELGAPSLPILWESVGRGDLYSALDRGFPYAALDTCATDGLCATACPVSIDTGQLVKRFRRLRQSPSAQEWAVRIAKYFELTESVLRWALRGGQAMQSLIGAGRMRSLTVAMKRFVGDSLRVSECTA
jgi:D-lactate dehydrogenase